MSAEAAEALDVRIPHTRREHAEGSRDPTRRFSGSSRLPRNLIARLVAEDGYNPAIAYALAIVAGWSYSDAQTLAGKLKYYELPAVTVDAIAVTNPAMLIVASAFFVRSECGRVRHPLVPRHEPTTPSTG